MAISIIFCVIGAFFSWLPTFIYYKKSLKQQSEESYVQINNLHEILDTLEKSKKDADEIEWQRRISESLKEFRSAGTPFHIINSYEDYSNERKEKLYDVVCLLKKGRKGKSNPFRNN